MYMESVEEGKCNRVVDGPCDVIVVVVEVVGICWVEIEWDRDDDGVSNGVPSNAEMVLKNIPLRILTLPRTTCQSQIWVSRRFRLRNGGLPRTWRMAEMFRSCGISHEKINSFSMGDESRRTRPDDAITLSEWSCLYKW